MSVYNWTGRVTNLPANDNDTKTAPGLTNNQGLHSLQGVHTSDLAYGQTQKDVVGARLQPESYYSNLFLERKRFKGEDLLFAGYAENRDIPKGNDRITLKRYQPLKAHTVPLVEGRKPSPDFAAGKAIVATTRAYGRYMEFTDQFDIKVADPVIEEYTTELGDVAAETIDLLAQAALLAEAQIFFPVQIKGTTMEDLVKAATGQSTASAIDPAAAQPSIEDLRLIGLYMEAAKVGKIGGTYHVLASPAVIFDLQTELFEKNVNAYGTSQAYSNNSMPDIFGLSFKKAPTARTVSVVSTTDNTKSAVVHHTLVLGAKAFTKVEVAGNGNVQFFTKALGSAGTLDPINQRQTMGWKINSIGFKVTDPDAVVNYITVPSQSTVISDTFDYVFNGKDAKLSNYGVTAEMADRIKNLEGVAIKPDDVVGAAVANIDGINTIDATTGQVEKLDEQFEGVAADGTVTAATKTAKTPAKNISHIKKSQ